jgi:hypothetical protein
MASTLIPGQRYDTDALAEEYEWVGWRGPHGDLAPSDDLLWLDWFGESGAYLGPDANGYEPLFSPR